MSKPAKIILTLSILFAVGLCLLGLAGFGAFKWFKGSYDELTMVVDEYVAHLDAGEYTSAHLMMSTPTQGNLSADELEKFWGTIHESYGTLNGYSFGGMHINTVNGRTTAELNLNGTFSGQNAPILVRMHKEDGLWKIHGFFVD